MFPGMPGPAEGPAVPGKPDKPWRGADARRTKRQAAVIAQGGHPLGLALFRPLKLHADAAADGRTCGNCRFREVISTGSSRNHPKCVIDRGPFANTGTDCPLPRVSCGAGTDIRKWWPGCVDHEFGDTALSDDAARSGPARAYADDHE